MKRRMASRGEWRVANSEEHLVTPPLTTCYSPFAIRHSLLASFHHPDLAEIFQHAGMDQLDARRRGNRVRGGGFAGLRELPAERALDPVQRPRQPIGDVIGQALARQNKTP